MYILYILCRIQSNIYKPKLHWCPSNTKQVRLVDAQEDEEIELQIKVVENIIQCISNYYNAGKLFKLTQFYHDNCSEEFHYTSYFVGFLNPVHVSSSSNITLRKFDSVSTFTEYITNYATAFPDAIYTMHKIILSEEGKVITFSVTFRGTKFGSITTTDKEVVMVPVEAVVSEGSPVTVSSTSTSISTSTGTSTNMNVGGSASVSQHIIASSTVERQKKTPFGGSDVLIRGTQQITLDENNKIKSIVCRYADAQ